MSKGRDNRNFKHGLFVGLTEYRYGPPEGARPITLAGSKPMPVLRGQQRDHLVNKVMDILRDWRQSPFEHEGPARAGLRSSLCTKGIGWQKSDDVAADIVATALTILGAERPSWEQGQRHFVEPRENCKWCGVKLNREDLVAGFCSKEHARFAYTHWGFETRRTADTAFAAVDRAIRRLRQKPRPCQECGKKFRPQSQESDQRFCSGACAGKLRQKHVHPRPCAHCGKTFVPLHGRMNLDARFCSQRCALDHRSEISIVVSCECCGTAFIAKGAKAMFCSMRCTQIVSKLRAGRRVARISPPVFDFLWTRHRRAAPSRHMTTALFDRLFREAA